jgi:hypothetical protein
MQLASQRCNKDGSEHRQERLLSRSHRIARRAPTRRIRQGLVIRNDFAGTIWIGGKRWRVRRCMHQGISDYEDGDQGDQAAHTYRQSCPDPLDPGKPARHLAYRLDDDLFLLRTGPARSYLADCLNGHLVGRILRRHERVAPETYERPRSSDSRRACGTSWSDLTRRRGLLLAEEYLERVLPVSHADLTRSGDLEQDVPHRYPALLEMAFR